MSFKHLVAAFEVTVTSSSHRLVLLGLADHADEHGYCWPSQNTLAERLMLSERTVRKVLSDFERLGIIRRAKRKGTSDEIWLLFSTARRSNQQARSTPVNDNMKQDANPGQPNSLWPDDAFELFWEVYPKKESKPFAEKAFEKVRNDGAVSFDVLLFRAKCYAKVRKDSPYTSSPANWLAGARWNDEYSQVVVHDAPPRRTVAI